MHNIDAYFSFRSPYSYLATPGLLAIQDDYNVAVNLSERRIHTYLGQLEPQLRNATYCSAGRPASGTSTSNEPDRTIDKDTRSCYNRIIIETHRTESSAAHLRSV